MKKISVIIPTHNRPGYLREAVKSIVNQTYKNWEIVIVDDASDPPADVQSLRDEFGSNILLVRNEDSLNHPYARHQGVQAASGDIITHLDDDDLLAEDALEQAAKVLIGNPLLDFVFLGAKGFGDKASYFDDAQSRAVAGVIDRGKGQEIMPGVISFGSGLFTALLDSIPVALQRVMGSRSSWNKVTSERRKPYMCDSGCSSEEAVARLILPPLRESELALYVAASCDTVLINKPLYLVRCDRQGYFSVVDYQEKQLEAKIDIMKHLLVAIPDLPAVKHLQPIVKKAVAKSYFAKAYYNCKAGRRFIAYKLLFSALSLHVRFSYIKLAIRILLPKKYGNGAT